MRKVGIKFYHKSKLWIMIDLKLNLVKVTFVKLA